MLNDQTLEGLSPIHIAADSGHTEVLSLLHDSGAEVGYAG
jgi:ankyrin repeat protein